LAEFIGEYLILSAGHIAMLGQRVPCWNYKKYWLDDDEEEGEAR
jgi:hypothetical protein